MEFQKTCTGAWIHGSAGKEKCGFEGFAPLNATKKRWKTTGLQEGLKSPRFPPSDRFGEGIPRDLILVLPSDWGKIGVGWELGCLGFRAWQAHTYPKIWEFWIPDTGFAQGIVSRAIQGHLLREAGKARRGFLLGITSSLFEMPISGIPGQHSSGCEGWE